MLQNDATRVCLRKAIAVIVVAATLSAICDRNGAAGSAVNDAVVLENSRIAVSLDKNTGAVRSIRDKQLGVAYQQEGIGWEITTDRGSLRPRSAAEVNRTDGAVAFRFDTKDFVIRLCCTLGRQDAFIEKWLEIEAKDGKPYFLKEVVLEKTKLGSPFREIHFHDDQTKWHCPINLFLRGEKGGCFAGLEYPYWKLDLRGRDGFRLGFTPNYPVEAGEQFVSEKYFLGVYRYEGVYRYSHGPFPGDRKPALLTFNNASVGHYPDTTDVPPEVLDWGEVWAMQRFMRHALPAHQPPDDGYYTWVNSWWAWAYNQGWNLGPKDIDLVAKIGIKDVMTQSMWLGHGQHPGATPYIVGMDPDKPVAFEATPEVQRLVEYGRSKGVHVSSFCSPGVYFDSKPGWLSLKKDGSPQTYCGWTKLNCFANDAHAAFMLKLYDRIFTQYGCRYWGFDGRWLSFREIPYPDGEIGPDPCYADNHGHLPGDNSYRECRNINHMLAELRRRHPRLYLETFYGLKRGGPWMLRYLNATENYYESNGSDQNRFQQWHNQNDRFLPPDRNYSAIFGRDSAAFRYSLISCLSGAPYCQVGAGLHQLHDEGNQAFFVKWRDWASRNVEYLQVKRDIFPCPGYGRVDGSVHLIKDRGFLFLFPTGLQPNTHTPGNDEGVRDKALGYAKLIRASIPIDHRLGFNERKDAVYKIVEIYPREGRVLGTYVYGDTLLYDMPKDSAVVLSLAPSSPGERVAATGFDSKAAEVCVVTAFGENLMTPEEFLRFSEQERADAVAAKAGFEIGGGEAINLVDGVAIEKLASIAAAQTPDCSMELGDLRLRAPATFAAWVWRSDLVDDRRLISQTAGSVEQGGAVRFQGKQLQVWDGRAWQVLISDGLEAERWLHVAVVFGDNGQATGYLNGELRETAVCRCDYRGVKAGVGAKFLGTNGKTFSGQIRGFQVRRNALSTGDLRELANQQPASTP